MGTLQDIKRAWLLRSLGLSSGGSMADLETALYNATRGVGSNRKFRPGSYYRHSFFSWTPSTASPVLGTVYYVPFEVGFTQAFVSLHCESTVAGTGGNTITMGIYTDEGGVPKTKLIDGSVSTAVAGEHTVPAAITLNPGMYYLALLSLTGVTPTIRTYGAHNNPYLGTTTWPGANNWSHYDLGGQASLVSPAPAIGMGGGVLCPMIQIKTAA